MLRADFGELPFRDCLENRNRARIEAPRATKRGQRTPDLVTSCCQSSLVEKPSGIFQTVSGETVWKVFGVPFRQ